MVFKYRIFLKPARRNTQVSIFLISIMVTMIALAFVIINIGKTAKDKTYTDNTVDASALSAASVMAYAFNYVANVNKNEQEKFEGNWEDFEDTFKKHFAHASNLNDQTSGASGEDPKPPKSSYKQESDIAKKQKCCSPVAGTASEKALEAAKYAYKYNQQINELIKAAWPAANSGSDQQSQGIGVLPNGAHLQESLYMAVRERVHDDGKNGQDLYQNALYAGYIFAFTNSGISHRLDQMTAPSYSSFLQSITPDSVSNCEAKTFSWTDGAGRPHMVTVTVCIGDVHKYKLIKTEMDRPQVKTNLDLAMKNSQMAMMAATAASGVYKGAKVCQGCSSTKVTCCPGIKVDGDTLMRQADILMKNADTLAENTKNGLIADGKKTSNSKTDTSDNIIKYIEDIQHDRKVQVFTSQFHMGGPVKGGRGDIDFPTFYPPVQSSAVADFRGQGRIYPQQPSHDAKLESAF